MNIKKSTLAAVLTAALAMGVSTQASAYVYAAAGLTIDNFTLSNNAGAVTINRFDFTLTNTAFLNGAGAVQGATCGGTLGSNNCSPVPPVLDAQPANAPGSTLIRPNNATTGGEFTFFGANPANLVGNWANSDSVINSAQLVTGSPTNTNNIAEALITSVPNASSQSDIRSVTGFTLTFTVGSATDLFLSFDADPDMRAAIFGEPSGSFSATANLNASFTLTRDGGGVFANWNPDGTAANDCIAAGVTCTETADTQDLNTNVGVTSNSTSDHSWDPNARNLTPFGITIGGLGVGTYTLTLNEVKSTTLARTVPEPGMLALLGIGLMGLLASTRRKKIV
jgi:hypothetical protein